MSEGVREAEPVAEGEGDGDGDDYDSESDVDELSDNEI
jgi:hypothetical protein